MAISWSAVAAAAWVDHPAGLFAVQTLAKFGPSLAGLALLLAGEGLAGTRYRLWAAVARPAGPAAWTIVLVGPFAVWCAILAAWQAAGDANLLLVSSAIPSLVPLLLQRFFLGGGLGEEIGWRGYLLPTLLERHTPLTASLIVGIVWGLWHAPAFWGFTSGKEGGATMLALFTVYTVALSVLFTLLWLRTGGNLLLCCVLHASLNATENWVKAVFPAIAAEPEPTLIFAGTIAVLALFGGAILWLRPQSIGHGGASVRANGD